MTRESVFAVFLEAVEDSFRYIIGGFVGAYTAIAIQQDQFSMGFLGVLFFMVLFLEIGVRLIQTMRNDVQDESPVNKEDLKAALSELADEDEIIVRRKKP